MELPSALFNLPPKNTKNPPRKKFLIFQEIKLSTSNNKKIILFSQKLSLYFRKWNPSLFSPSSKNKKTHPEKFLIFREMEVSSSNLKKFLILLETKILKKFLIFPETETSKKFFYISRNGNPKNFLYLRK